MVLVSACGDDDTGATPGDGKDAGGDEGGSNGSESGSGGKGGKGGTGGAISTAGTGSGGEGGSSGESGSGGTGTAGSGDEDGGVDGGTDGGVRCGVVTCDPLATCDDSGSTPKCECPDGYEDTSGFGTRCEPPDGAECVNDDDCESDHCVAGVCCASACDEPGTCQTAEGATCEGGETCVYANADDGSECDDDSVCTESDACDDGECIGAMIDCDDENLCTADSCDAEDGCIHDGTDITTENCLPDDMCNMDYTCAGNVRGDCVAVQQTDCTTLTDQCNEGVCDLDAATPGTCIAVPREDGTACDDDDACTQDNECMAGQCNAGTTITICTDGNPCTDDPSCDPEIGCSNPPNTADCDDGDPCTVNDECFAGACTNSDPKDCSSADDECNVGVCNPSNGDCEPDPVPNNTECDDALVCTNASVCTGGTCGDPDDDSACGDGALSCSEGGQRTCTCDDGYFFDTSTRTCQADVCDMDPCGPNATCTAPGGNRTCTCNNGYEGNDPGEAGCTNINECASDPCGQDIDCIENAPGEGYTCDCPDGETYVNGQCVCDLNGTYAIRFKMVISWPPVAGALDGGSAADTFAWAIRNQTYDSDGNLHTVTIPCGGTSPAFCGAGLYDGEAYGSFDDHRVWGTASAVGSMQTQVDDMSIPNALAGQTFLGPVSAALSGIHLNDPLGDWPESASDIDDVPNGTNTNDYWTDDDLDGQPGFTSFAMQPSEDSLPYPGGARVPEPPPDQIPVNTCGGGTDWEYLPSICSPPFGTCALKAIFSGSRVLSQLEGTIQSCDEITGFINGDEENDRCGLKTSNATVPECPLLAESRISGCWRQTSGTSETLCTTTARNWLDGQPPTNTIDSATFIIRRVPENLLSNDVTCQEVREMDFE